MSNFSRWHGSFQPVFVVGAPRSGTTLLAVMLNRHSELAIPPETQFFTEFIHDKQASLPHLSRKERLQAALQFKRIVDLNLRYEDVWSKFSLYDNSLVSVFRAILEVYALQEGKACVGEKSPKHLEHVDYLLSVFPNAKVLCIVRDGRDVVRSLLKTSWAEPNNPRRFGLFCMEWADYARKAKRYEEKFSASQFRLVRYEELLFRPNECLAEVCSFLGFQYEEQMTSAGAESGSVPGWEAAWKNKATDGVDSSRAYAWQHQATKAEIWRMNVMMRRELELLGYHNTVDQECPALINVLLHLRKIPYLAVFRPVSLFGLKFLRFFNECLLKRKNNSVS